MTKESKHLSWDATYEYTQEFFNSRPELKVGAEIGIAGGNHIIHLLEHTNLEKIYGVDPLIFESWNVPFEIEDFDLHYKSVCQSLDPYGERVEIIRKTSVDGSKDFENKSLDFVFIDAIHEYKECLEDITVWEPKVKSGGYIMGHDWDHPNFPGVESAVREYFDLRREQITGTGSPIHVWFVKKVWS